MFSESTTLELETMGGEVKLSELSEQINLLEGKFESMEDNLDPTGQEVLSISRLRDIVLSLDRDMQRNNELMNKKIELFEKNNKAVLGTYRDSLNWVYMLFVAALLPILIDSFRNRSKNAKAISSLEDEIKTLRAQIETASRQ